MKSKIQALRQNTAHRIVFNTILIYAQKFSTAALALVTTPLLLRMLGIEDYGIYTLTLGFVGMLTFFTWSLSASTQRYISVTLGEKDYGKLSRILSSSFIIHLIYGLIIVGVIEIISFYFVNDFLNIPAGRQDTIKYILSFVAGISFFNIIAIPFIGALRAAEDFFSIAVIGVAESCLKLLMAFLLLVVPGDKLIIFSALMFLVSCVIFAAYFFRVIRAKDSLFTGFSKPDMTLIKEMLAFISWTLLGALAVMSRNQGVSVVLNIFFGVVTNAAYGISQQVNNALNILSQGVGGSMAPVLMKSAGEKNYDKMFYMMRSMAKMSFFSISIFSIPFFFEMPFILKLWLKDVPADSVVFSQWIIILVLAVILSSGMQNVFVAIGKVKTYNIYVSVFLILNLPISYLMFKMGFANYTIIVVGVVLELITLNIRLYLLKKFLNYDIRTYITELGQILLPTLIVSAALYLLCLAGLPPLVKFILSFAISLIISPLVIYRYSLDAQQKQYVMNIISKFKRK